MKKYRFAFDPWGLLLFLLIMLPNFIWFAVPAPNDILRGESCTPVIDSIGSICQILMIAALCLLAREHRPPGPARLLSASGGCVLLYYTGWICYYLSFTGPPVILLLTAPPCLAFLLFAVARRNFPAVFLAACFTLCHLIYAAANFIL